MTQLDRPQGMARKSQSTQGAGMNGGRLNGQSSNGINGSEHLHSSGGKLLSFSNGITLPARILSNQALRMPDYSESSSANVQQNGTATSSNGRPQSNHRPNSQNSTRTNKSTSAKPQTVLLRHGWEESEAMLRVLKEQFYMYYSDKKYERGASPRDPAYVMPKWRTRERLKVPVGGVALCLNLGVDPPDAIRTEPGARFEAWMDTLTYNPNIPNQKLVDKIAQKFATQFERHSIRTKMRSWPDPVIEDFRRNCMSLRKVARDDRALFYYNGHGVPKPTSAGEMWVFNKAYSQYIPVSLFDLQEWLASPSMLIYDCSGAGAILENWEEALVKHRKINEEKLEKDKDTRVPNYEDFLQVAACAADENLPTHPDLPADLFTACLTTPLEMAVRFYLMHAPFKLNISLDDAMKIPGKASERKSPLGELTWIFTSVTDTIAWDRLDKTSFTNLFRQDLMVAAMYRNFVLSQRVMRQYNCNPISWPKIPRTWDHQLWDAWDLAVDNVLQQLPALLEAAENKTELKYIHSEFFTEQLTAFEIYLREDALSRKQPLQLPILLQVLLSQTHRLRALRLLKDFLNLGPWAVELALLVGIFPYVTKLLQSASLELRDALVSIWARILAVDTTAPSDLVKDSGWEYFYRVLDPEAQGLEGDLSVVRGSCCFIFAQFCDDHQQAKIILTSQGRHSEPSPLFGWCQQYLHDLNPLLRQWATLCAGKVWENHPEGKYQGYKQGLHLTFLDLRTDPVPEVRAATVFSLSTMIGVGQDERVVGDSPELTIAANLLEMLGDGSMIVRRELVGFFSHFVPRFSRQLQATAFTYLETENASKTSEISYEPNLPMHGQLDSELNDSRFLVEKEKKLETEADIFSAVWEGIMQLTSDPHPEVAHDASLLVHYIYFELAESPLKFEFLHLLRGNGPLPAQKGPLKLPKPMQPNGKPSPDLRKSASNRTMRPLQTSQSHVSLLKRTMTFGGALKDAITSAAYSRPVTPEPEPPKQTNGTTQRMTVLNRPQTDWVKPLAPDAGTSHPFTKPELRPDNPKATPKYWHPRSFDAEGGRPVLPFVTPFYKFSGDYFRESQLERDESQENGSEAFNIRYWRRERNERIITWTQAQKTIGGQNRWDHTIGTFGAGHRVERITWHQYENHLISADDRDVVSVWDWEKHKRLSRFSNQNPLGCRITAMKLINEDDQALLLVGSEDGIVKLYRDYEDSSKVELITAWRALTNMQPSTHNSGLVFEWQQGPGRLLVAGDVRTVKLWDPATETCVADVPARSKTCITSLTSDQVAGNIFVAGFGNGTVRVYDARLDPRDAMIRAWKKHDSWIANVHMQRGGQRELISAERRGYINLWDIRMDNPVKRIDAIPNRISERALLASGKQPEKLRDLGVHEHAPVLATGTDSHATNVFNLNTGQVINPIYSGPGSHQTPSTPANTAAVVSNLLAGTFVSRRVAPNVAACFHPHRMMVAVSALEGGLTVVQCRGAGKEPYVSGAALSRTRQVVEGDGEEVVGGGLLVQQARRGGPGWLGGPPVGSGGPKSNSQRRREKEWAILHGP